MSATPWNLVTSSHRFCNLYIGYNPNSKKFELAETQGERRKLRNICPLYDISWALASNQEYINGKTVRLMVSLLLYF